MAMAGWREVLGCGQGRGSSGGGGQGQAGLAVPQDYDTT